MAGKHREIPQFDHHEGAHFHNELAIRPHLSESEQTGQITRLVLSAKCLVKSHSFLQRITDLVVFRKPIRKCDSFLQLTLASPHTISLPNTLSLCGENCSLVASIAATCHDDGENVLHRQSERKMVACTTRVSNVEIISCAEEPSV